MENKTIYGIIGILILATGGTGIYTLLQMQEDPNLYICSITNATGRFESLSSSNKTGYWYVDTVRKQATCTGGYWLRPEAWASLNNISMDAVTDLTPTTEDITQDYVVQVTCPSIPNFEPVQCESMIDAVCISNNQELTCDEWVLN